MAVDEDAIAETMTFGQSLTPGYAIAWTDAVGLHDAATATRRAIVSFSEALRLAQTQAARVAWSDVVDQRLKLSSVFSPGYKLTVAEALALGATSQGVLGVSVREAFALAGAATPRMAWVVSAADGIRLIDAASHGMAAIVLEQLHLQAQAQVKRRAAATLTGAIALDDALSEPLLTAAVVVREGLTLSADMVLQALLFGRVVEGLRVVATTLDPDATTSWAINTRTGAVTEYRGVRHDSYGMLGRRQIGLGRDGLWALEGPSDDGKPIVSRLRGGVLEMNGGRLTGLRAIYLGMRTSSEDVEHYLKLIGGDGQLYVYRFRPRDMRTTRVQPARGLRARYFQWELELVGADFALDEIEFVPMRTARRMGR